MAKNSKIVSIFNLKSGLGCSTLCWNLANILEMDMYVRENNMYNYYSKQRKEFLDSDIAIKKVIPIEPINKLKFKDGIYDLGSDINYGFVRQILSKSKVIIIPTEIGHESIMKTIASIKYAKEHSSAKIILVFNKLNPMDPDREKKYSLYALEKIKDFVDMNSIDVVYIRTAFAFIREQEYGRFILDHYINQDSIIKDISNFRLLQYLRWKDIDNSLKPKLEEDDGRYRIKNFYENFKDIYIKYNAILAHHNTVKSKDNKKEVIKDVIDKNFMYNNRKAIKDVLILSTRVEENFTDIYKD